MPIGMRTEDMEREIEIAIVRAFGWAVIEFEAVLFQKFLVMSAPTSLMTEDMFRKHLKQMEAKGYISPLDFQGKKSWKRLVIESDIDEIALTPEEVREFLEKAKATEKKDRKTSQSEKVVSESKELAERILMYLEKGIPEKASKKKIGQRTVFDHVEAMRHALAESKESYLGYIRKNLPSAYKDMERILNVKGEEVLLLSLRVIESGYRMYPPQ